MPVNVAKAWCRLWFQNSQVWTYLEDKWQNLLSSLSSFTCFSEARFCSVAQGGLVPTLWPKLAPHLRKFSSVSQVLGYRVWAPNPALCWLFSAVNPAPSKSHSKQWVSQAMCFSVRVCVWYNTLPRGLGKPDVVPHTYNPKCWVRSIAVSSRPALAT